jgi:hypothetical protein
MDNYNLHMSRLYNSNNTKGLEPGKVIEPKKPVRLPLIFPPISLCTDNGVMVAWAGIEKLNMNISDSIDGQEAIPKWSIGKPFEDTYMFKKTL